MVDVVDRSTRSRMMSGIRSKNTSPELKLRRALHRLGFRYRLHRRDLPGTPDIVLPKWKAIVEVQGCFWHRHTGCALAAEPDDPTGRWAAKFKANVERDARNRLQLEKLGWRTLLVWECAMRSRGAENVAARVAWWLRNGRRDDEISHKT